MKGKQAIIIKCGEARTKMGSLDILRLQKGRTCLVRKKFKKKEMNVKRTTKKAMVTVVWVILNLI